MSRIDEADHGSVRLSAHAKDRHAAPAGGCIRTQAVKIRHRVRIWARTGGHLPPEPACICRPRCSPASAAIPHLSLDRLDDAVDDLRGPEIVHVDGERRQLAIEMVPLVAATTQPLEIRGVIPAPDP